MIFARSPGIARPLLGRRTRPTICIQSERDSQPRATMAMEHAGQSHPSVRIMGLNTS